MNKKQILWLKLMNIGHICGCHQLPNRSFFYKGYQFPICARCIGVMIGYFISFIYRQNSITVNLILMLTMLIDWSLQFAKIKSSTNLKRLITGTMGGYGLMNIYIIIISGIYLLLGKYSIYVFIGTFAVLFITYYLLQKIRV
ncbi:DUF2085 domain-containing protein [Clostridium sp. C2-6-12]|uniref:DUF2085 domain-containing protein n=1 Tax=Clostridium sp. C2-6-12 TaxID=2698832 RepID=UPI0013715228|nr:DUF2085 domain-containing protein [Clostridium sp. C2-6-12]